MVLVTLITACGGNSVPSQQQELVREIADRPAYEQTNDVEFELYNRRQQIADDPTTILWCTFFPLTQGQEPFTVPIVSKLASSGKRPFPTEQDCQSGGDKCWAKELPGPDKMYGSSSEYRFGFTPADQYIDFTDLHSFCTTVPTVWQANKTTIVMEVDTELGAANAAARKELKAGNTEAAYEILKGATGE
jgi:hypothetical protein